jgi:hypothetical protein
VFLGRYSTISFPFPARIAVLWKRLHNFQGRYPQEKAKGCMVFTGYPHESHPYY